MLDRSWILQLERLVVEGEETQSHGKRETDPFHTSAVPGVTVLEGVYLGVEHPCLVVHLGGTPEMTPVAPSRTFAREH